MSAFDEAVALVARIEELEAEVKRLTKIIDDSVKTAHTRKGYGDDYDLVDRDYGDYGYER